MKTTEILIIGAGAAGLMAARELSKAGKKVIILEARDRIGGRIWPLSKEKYGYPAQAGAEFVHGKAPVTKALIQEAGLTYEPSSGEMWNIRDGSLSKSPEIVLENKTLGEKLKELKEDIPIGQFLNLYFSEEKYALLRNSVFKMVEGFDAADPNKISSFSLREEWLGGEGWEQGKIKEGYGALLDFLQTECIKNNVEIKLNEVVTGVAIEGENVVVTTQDTKEYKANKAIITLSLPLLSSIAYTPKIPEKLKAASQIGFGSVIKILLQFSDSWWSNARDEDFSAMGFMLSNEIIPTWWTQYPDRIPSLIGWLAGPTAEKFKDASSDEILGMAILSLTNIFQVEERMIREKLKDSTVINWPADQYARGAYSYATPESKAAQTELLKPVQNIIFFAGEALYSGKETATVEGALASGLATAKEILKI